MSLHDFPVFWYPIPPQCFPSLSTRNRPWDQMRRQIYPKYHPQHLFEASGEFQDWSSRSVHAVQGQRHVSSMSGHQWYVCWTPPTNHSQHGNNYGMGIGSTSVNTNRSRLLPSGLNLTTLAASFPDVLLPVLGIPVTGSLRIISLPVALSHLSQFPEPEEWRDPGDVVLPPRWLAETSCINEGDEWVEDGDVWNIASGREERWSHTVTWPSRKIFRWFLHLLRRSLPWLATANLRPSLLQALENPASVAALWLKDELATL